MTKSPQSLPNDLWEEIPGMPYHYQLKEYTAEQIERLSLRPTEMINAALRPRDTESS